MICPDSRGRSGTVRIIATYVEQFCERPVAGPAREAAFRCVLDLLGATMPGMSAPGVAAVRSTALKTMGAGDVPIWFAGAGSSVIGAAWANSAAAAALDLDDGHRLARGHPGAAVIPAVFAVAHETGATLEQIVSAIVIGYEVGVAIGAARVAYGNTGTWSSYAVVAAAAALRRTPRETLEHALAIAGESGPNQLFSSAPVPRSPAPEGSAVKEGIPWSVVTGLVALGLAEDGHTGPRNILDSTRHYRFPDPLSLGASPHICNTYFKLYACCRHVHAPLDAMLGVIHRHHIDVKDIDAVEVESTSGAMRISNRARPENLIDAQYSVPYCLAIAAMLGPGALLPMTEKVLENEALAELAGKVELSISPEFDAVFPAQTLARVTVTSRGQRFVSPVTSPRGEASDPLSWAELEAKFRTATRMLATDIQQDRILGSLGELRSGSLAALKACLARPVGSRG